MTSEYQIFEQKQKLKSELEALMLKLKKLEPELEQKALMLKLELELKLGQLEELEQLEQPTKKRSWLLGFLSVKRQIEIPPGLIMLRLAELLVSPERFQLCEAAVADWQEEYIEALDQKRGLLKMAFIRIRHTWGFLKATGLLVLIQYVGKLIKKLAGK